MTRPDYCPVSGEPCQSMCDEPCSWASPIHKRLSILASFIHEVALGAYPEDKLPAKAMLALTRAGFPTLESVLDLVRAGASLVGLPQDDGIVTGPRDVDQSVSVPAAGADEEAAVLVQIGGDGLEHDRKVAVPTGPHGPDVTPRPAAYAVRFITDDEGIDPWDDIYYSPDTAREVAEQRRSTGVDGDRWEVVPLYLAASAQESEILTDARRALDAWNSSPLPKARDGRLQECMECLRVSCEQTSGGEHG